jgi:very-short-patch-repair endonuclease
VSPQVCIGQLAEDLSVLDLTIAIDSALYQRLCNVVDIEAAIRSRQRGLPRLRQALLLCDGRSESPWETILRLIHVAAGIEVEPQAQICDDADRFLARADLRIRGTRRLAEYDGAVHRDRFRHESDLHREKALARAGYERYGYIATELRQTPELVIGDAERALGLPHDGRRVVAWNELAHPSTLTRDGWMRLLHRLHRFD